MALSIPRVKEPLLFNFEVSAVCYNFARGMMHDGWSGA